MRCLACSKKSVGDTCGWRVYRFGVINSARKEDIIHRSTTQLWSLSVCVCLPLTSIVHRKKELQRRDMQRPSKTPLSSLSLNVDVRVSNVSFMRACVSVTSYFLASLSHRSCSMQIPVISIFYSVSDSTVGSTGRVI